MKTEREKVILYSKFLAIFFVIVFGGIFIYNDTFDFLPDDTCEDSGGVWNNDLKECVKEERTIRGVVTSNIFSSNPMGSDYLELRPQGEIGSVGDEKIWIYYRYGKSKCFGQRDLKDIYKIIIGEVVEIKGFVFQTVPHFSLDICESRDHYIKKI